MVKNQKKKARQALRKSRRGQGLDPEDYEEEVIRHTEDFRRLQTVAEVGANDSRERSREESTVDSRGNNRVPSGQIVGPVRTHSIARSNRTNVTNRSKGISALVQRHEAELIKLKQLEELELKAAALREELKISEENAENSSQNLDGESLNEEMRHENASRWVQDLPDQLMSTVEPLAGKPTDGTVVKESSSVDNPNNNVDNNVNEIITGNSSNDILTGISKAIQMLASQQVPQGNEMKKMIVRQAMGRTLPTFTGEPEEWPAFIEKYRRTTEACGFSDGENLDRLQKCLSGKAKLAVQAMLIVPEKVPEIINTLEMNFGQPEVIVHTMVRKAKEMPPAHDGKPQSMIDLANAVKNLVSTVQHLKKAAHLQNPDLLCQLTSKLPDVERMKWAKEKFKKKDVDLSDFATWLETRAKICNELRVLQLQSNVKNQADKRSQDSRKFQDSNKNQKNQKFEHRKKDNVFATAEKYPEPAFSGKVKLCSFCRKHGHIIYDCHQFLALSVNDRWKWARERKACYSCLEFTHLFDKCENQMECGLNGCPRMHHRLMCSKPEPSEEKTVGETAKLVGHMSRDVKTPKDRVLLRVLPVVLKGPEKEIKTFALLDEAATTTIIDAKLAKELGLKGPTEMFTSQWTDETTRTISSQLVSMKIRNPWNHTYYNLEDVQTDENLKLPLQTVCGKEMSKKWPHLRGFEFLSYQNARPTILIGENYRYLKVPRELKEGRPNDPGASRCLLGWSIHGNSGDNMNRVDQNFTLHVFGKEQPFQSEFLYGGEQAGNACHHFIGNVNPKFAYQDGLDELHQIVKQQFSIESFGVKVATKNLLSKEDKRVMSLAEATTKKIENRWETGLLWKDENIYLPASKSNALNRLVQVERKMDRSPEFASAYCGKIKEFLDKNYAHKLTHEEAMEHSPRTWYLPHFGHVNPNKPGKIRLVFDAAAKANGTSLNDKILKGMNLVNPLPNVLFGFREKGIGFCGDIREMFPQIKIIKEDQSSQRFLFRGMNRNSPPEVYEMSSMIFGSASSPYSAQFVKNKNARCHEKEFPDAAKAIIDKHYVDDYLDSADTVEDAVKLIRDVHEVHSRGGFEIVNFTSSSREVLEELPKNLVAEHHKDLTLDDEYPMERVLGLYWNPKEDCFSFRTSFKRYKPEVMSGEDRPTKRMILSIVMTVYDVLGFISHFTIKSRILLQEVWRTEIGWDDELPWELFEKWKLWLSELPNIGKVKVPRCYTPRMRDGEIQLHIFVDASSKAYAAVAYFRVELQGEISTSLIMAKSKVSPLKIVSIPRLELQAALMGSRMAETLRKSHNVIVSATHYWSDSKTVLAWLRSDAKKFSIFVAHRVGEIEELTDVKDWHWVPSKENVADEATRDGMPTEFGPEDRWFVGPAFLRKPPSEWPKVLTTKQLLEEVSEEEMEFKKEFIGVHICRKGFVDWNRFSKWYRLKRSMAYVLRFIEVCKYRRKIRSIQPKIIVKEKKVARKIMSPMEDPPSGALTVDELKKAEEILLRQAQHECFAEDIAILTKGKMVLRSSRLLKLSPKLNEKGLLVLRGRLENAPSMERCTQQPIIMDPKHHCTLLLIQHYHENLGHHGKEKVLNEMRQKYWVIDGRGAVNKVWNNCQWCKVQRAKPINPEMAPLPEIRLTRQVRPFVITGLDYFGPITVTVGRRHEKRYGALFTCLTTRAVHLEIAHSLSTDSAIMAIRRFIARRGCPKEIHSDNGTNFHGAKNELKKSFAEINQEKIGEEAVSKGILWKFIPPGAPHMGGAWERLVKAVKVALYAILKERAPKDEVLLTLLAEVEHTVNSRPLTHVSLDPDDPESLTPNHFLFGSSSGVQQFGEFEDLDLCLRKQWRVSQALADMFWRRWQKEYVPSLVRRQKWHQKTTEVKVGDVVFIADGNQPRNSWPRGVVTAAFPGKDGVVRVVHIRTAKGDFRRPVSKIAVIEIPPEEERIAPKVNSRGEDVEEQRVQSGVEAEEASSV